MTIAKLIWNYLWIAPACGQMVILWVMVPRDLHRQFPLFFIHTAYTVGQFLTLFPMYYLVSLVPGWLYGHTRLCLVAGGAALKFGVTYEIFMYVGRSYQRAEVFSPTSSALRHTGAVRRSHCPGATHAYEPTDNSVMFTERLLDRSVAFLQCGLMLGLLSLSRILHMRWQKPAFGIALGLAITASANLILLAINTEIGYYRPLDYGYMGSYHVAVLVWLYYLATPEKTAKTTPDFLPDHRELEAWRSAIKSLLQNG